jgi:hypothetical protein
MDDDGSALRVRSKYQSLTDLECALKNFPPEPFAFKLGSNIIKSYDSSINILFQVNNTGSMNHLLFGRNKIARNN